MKISGTYAVALLMAGAMVSFASCNDKDAIDPDYPGIEAPAQTEGQAEDYISNSRVYISRKAFADNPRYREDLNHTFPHLSGSDNAALIVVDASEVTENLLFLNLSYNRGITIAITNITPKTVETLRQMGQDAEFDQIDFKDRIMVAYNKNGFSYVMAQSGVTSDPVTVEDNIADNPSRGDVSTADGAANTLKGKTASAFGAFGKWLDQSSGRTRTDDNQAHLTADLLVTLPRMELRHIPCSSADNTSEKTAHLVFDYTITKEENYDGGVRMTIDSEMTMNTQQLYHEYSRKHGAVKVEALCNYLKNLEVSYSITDNAGTPLQVKPVSRDFASENPDEANISRKILDDGTFTYNFLHTDEESHLKTPCVPNVAKKMFKQSHQYKFSYRANQPRLKSNIHIAVTVNMEFNNRVWQSAKAGKKTQKRCWQGYDICPLPDMDSVN